MKKIDFGARPNHQESTDPRVILSDLVEDMTDLKIFLLVKDCPDKVVGLEFQEDEIAMYSCLKGVPEKTYVESPRMAEQGGDYTPVDAVLALLGYAGVTAEPLAFVAADWRKAKDLSEFEPHVEGVGAKAYRTMDGVAGVIHELYPHGWAR